jgi:hypothetical protein
MEIILIIVSAATLLLVVILARKSSGSRRDIMRLETFPASLRQELGMSLQQNSVSISLVTSSGADMRQEVSTA